jgi:hypothetical protein
MPSKKLVRNKIFPGKTIAALPDEKAKNLQLEKA